MKSLAVRNLGIAVFAMVVASCATSNSPKALSDQQIAMVVRTANDAAIQQAQVASPRLTDAGARDLAQSMVRDHSASNDRARKLFIERNLVPAESSQSRSFRSTVLGDSQTLATLGGTALDRAYVEGQARMHRDLLGMIDKTLFPSARDQTLRDFLTEMRVSVAAHLVEVEAIERRLPK